MLPGIPIEFEVVIFGSMITTIAFGFWAGLFVALLGSVFAEFLNQQISPYSLVNFGCYILVPIVAFFLRGAAVSNFAMVATAGIVLTVIVNLIIFTIFIFMGYDHFKNAAFSITNIFFNYLLFKYLTIPVLGLLL